MLNDSVVSECFTLFVYFAVASLVDEFTYWFQVWIAPGDVGLGDSQHVYGCFVQFDEHTVVDLSETEQFQAFSYFWMNTVNTRKKKKEKKVKKIYRI